MGVLQTIAHLFWRQGLTSYLPRAGHKPQSAKITEVLDQKGLREGMNRRDKGKYSFTQEGNDKTHIERARRLMTNWKNFIFLSKLYTKEEET
jgi:hypothetical protein